MTTLALLLLAILPRDTVVRETVDLIETNHFFDENGQLVFDQVIFYDWSSVDGRYNVRAWRLVKFQGQIPQRDWATGKYYATWQDGDRLRHIQSHSIRETFTQYDPELIEREHLPKERRKELRVVRLNKPSGPRP